MQSWPKNLILAFFLCLLVFSPWEIIMSQLGVVAFSTTQYAGLPWWVPLAFGLVGLFGVLVFSIADFLFKITESYRPRGLVGEYLLILAFYGGIFFSRQYPYVLALGLFFVIMVRLIFFHRELDFLFFVFGACLGPTLEIILINLGLFTYNEPDFMGMPAWLPIFWGNVALALRRVAWVLKSSPKTLNKRSGAWAG